MLLQELSRSNRDDIKKNHTFMATKEFQLVITEVEELVAFLAEASP